MSVAFSRTLLEVQRTNNTAGDQVGAIRADMSTYME